MKNFRDPIGNRTRYLPTCSTTTAPPPAPKVNCNNNVSHFSAVQQSLSLSLSDLVKIKCFSVVIKATFALRFSMRVCCKCGFTNPDIWLSQIHWFIRLLTLTTLHLVDGRSSTNLCLPLNLSAKGTPVYSWGSQLTVILPQIVRDVSPSDVDLREVGWGVVGGGGGGWTGTNWLRNTWRALVNAVINLLLP
jgi:hypothetical protein